VVVVAAYGLLLPQSVLDLPRLGCLNIHASLLPRWRGAAPTNRADAGRRAWPGGAGRGADDAAGGGPAPGRSVP